MISPSYPAERATTIAASAFTLGHWDLGRPWLTRERRNQLAPWLPENSLDTFYQPSGC